MATFVLVHGSWHGGWCWRLVTPLLRAAGHDVYTPTLTGLGERAHLLHDRVTLATHVQDVERLLFYEDLSRVWLVGHSYVGVVVSGVAARVPERLAGLFYLDAYLVWLNKAADSTSLRLHRLGVYCIARYGHCLQPEEWL